MYPLPKLKHACCAHHAGKIKWIRLGEYSRRGKSTAVEVRQPFRYPDTLNSREARARRCIGNFAGSLACRGHPYPAILSGGQTPSCPTEGPRMIHDRTACFGICSKLRTLGQKPWSFLSARSPFSFKHSCKVDTRSSASSRGTRCNSRQSVPPAG